MENLLRNPGLQHIVEKFLKVLGHVDIASFRLLNQNCKHIVDYPEFYLMKLSHQENVPKDLIKEWRHLILKLNDEEIRHDLMLELFKMTCRSLSKYPLQLAYDLSDEKRRLDLAKFIIENSPMANYVKAKKGYVGNLSPIHLAAMYGYVETANRMISNNSTESNPSDIHGITPIFLAAEYGNLEIVQILMTLTSNPNVAGYLGQTPIHRAAERGYLEIVR